MAEIKKINTDLQLEGKLLDGSGSAGTSGQILSSTGTATDWISLSEISGVDGAGTANYVAKWSDTDTITNSVIYDNGTNVGIGTTSPGAKLHISSNTGGQIYLTDADLASANTHNINSANGAFQIGTRNNNFSFVDTFYQVITGGSGATSQQFLTQGTTRLLINSSGNVGIGTTSPITKLTVGAYSGARLPYINGTANTFDSNGITVTSSNTANASIGGGIDLTNNVHSVGSFSPLISFSALSQSENYNNNYAAIYGILAGDSGDGNWNRGHIAFATATAYGASEKMRITSSGNVGIGTTSPDRKLEVQGVISSADAGLQKSTFANVGNDLVLTANADATNVTAKMLFNSSGAGGGTVSTKMIIDGAGNVGIGTTTPTTTTGIKLDVIGGIGAWAANNTSTLKLFNGRLVGAGRQIANLVSTNGNGSLELYRSDNLLNVLITGYGNSYLNGGNVGIGTTSPLSKLHISNGGVLPSSVTQNNKNLTISGDDAIIDLLSYDDNTTVATSFGMGRYSQVNGNLIDKWGLVTWYDTGNQGSNLSDRLSIHYGASGTPWISGEKVSITREGNVGIGTTSPDAKLEVAGGSTGIILSNLGNSGAYDAVSITYSGYNSGTPEFVFQPKTAPGSGTVNSWFRFKTQGSVGQNIANVTVDGNVGIGTTTPAKKLHVNGASQFDSDVYQYGVNYGLYHGTIEDDYYFDDYSGSRYLSLFYKNAYADILRYQPIDNLEYWDGSAWQDMSSQAGNVKRLLDGRKDTNWYVPSTYYKFRFTTNLATSWPTRAMIWLETSWTGSTYPGGTVTIEEDVSGTWTTRVTADFNSSNGVTTWGLMARADSALHTGVGSSSNSTRITVDFYGWSPSNPSYVTLPLQNIMITSQFSGSANTDYSALLDYDKTLTAPGKLYITTTDTNTSSTSALVLNGNEVEKRTLGSNAFNSTDFWHSGNDGSGSGLDADLLDGQHGSYYAAASHNHDSDYVNVTGDTMTGNLSLGSNNLTAGKLIVQNQINTNSANLEINYQNGDGTTTNYKDLYVRDGKNNVIMVVDGSAGGVGIGINSPGYKLDVLKVGGDAINIGAGNDFSGIRFTSDAHTYSWRVGGDNLFIYDVTNTAQRVTIDSSGYVGIGNTSPTSGLDVSGIITARSGQILRRYVPHWTNATTHDVIYNGWTTSTQDYVYLKVQGNGTTNHGIAAFGDVGFWLGRTDIETGPLTDSATNPIGTVWLRSDSSGNITATGTITATGGNSTEWNTAYGWGDHSQAGYLTGVTNISGYSGTLLREDNRTISPSELTSGRLKFGFTSWNNNNTSPYADFIHMRSYTDSSGGSDNLVMFKKNGIGMRLWQQTYGSATAYSSYADVWTSNDFTSTNVANWNTAYGWGDHSGLYAAASHTHAASDITSGTFADARIALTNITQHTDPKYLRSDTADTATGAITFSGQVNLNSTVRLDPNGTNFEIDTDSTDRVIFSFNKNGTRNWSLRAEGGNLNFYRDSGSGNIEINNNRILTTADEGSGNGLDADTLDGQQGSYYLAWGNLTGVPSTFAPSAHTLDSHSNVTITSNSSGEILKWNGSAWVNNTLAEAGIAAASHTHDDRYYTETETNNFFSGTTAITGYNKTNWDSAYNNSITSAAVTGTTTKTLTLNQQDGGTVTASWSDADSGVTGSGTTNFVAKFTSSSTLGNSQIKDDGTNVGVGTVGPTKKLSVVETNTSIQDVAEFKSLSTTRAYIAIRDANTNTLDDYVRFGAVGDELTLWAGNSEAIRIDSSQNVGIGFNNPSYKLDVLATGTVAARFYTGSDDTKIIIQDNDTARYIGVKDNKLYLGPNSSGISSDNVYIGTAAVGIGNDSTNYGRLTITNTLNQIALDTGTAGDGRLHIGHFSNGSFIGTYGDDAGAADLLRFGTHSGDERMRIASNGDVGINDTNPQVKLSVKDTNGVIAGFYGTGAGTASIRVEQTGSAGSAAIELESASTSYDNYIRSDRSIWITTLNGLGLRFKFEDDGDFHADGDVIAYSTTTSDARLKDDVKPIENAIDKVKAINGVEYTWNAGGRKGQKDLGVIAQNVEEVIPEIVREKKMDLMDGEVYKTVDYDKLTALLIEAVKEQQKQIEELKAQIDGLSK